MTIHEKKARELFENGYNCAQAVFTAFSDVTGIDEETSKALSSSFGGGMGRMREVCGAVSGMLMAAGMLYGGDCNANSNGGAAKSEHYARVRLFMERFKDENGSYICRELLELPVGQVGGEPEQRTKEYYQRRPCSELVGCAARILDEYATTAEG